MAKGNMLLGYSKGSVGDVTFYRSGGSQRARSRNRNPNNPRSTKQQTQRALFANCVKFYKLTVSRFFKFAFENKKTNESDYNAFMRENLKRGVMMSKTAFYVEPYPALGNWLMSRGSLATIQNVKADAYDQPIFDLGATYSGIPAADITIGTISAAMVASGRYQVGDIITIVKYFADADDLPTATPNTETGTLQTNFQFWQFLVDPNSSNTFASIFGDSALYHIVTTATSGTLAIMYGADSSSASGENWRYGYNSTTVIHSRNTSNGLLVSTQELSCNEHYIDAVATAAIDAAYKSAVLTDWSASGEAILQGEGLELIDLAAIKYFIGNSITGTAVMQTATVTGCDGDDFKPLYIQFEDNETISPEVAARIFYGNIVSSEGLKVVQDITPTRISGQTANIYQFESVLDLDTPWPNKITVRNTMPRMTGTMTYTE